MDTNQFIIEDGISKVSKGVKYPFKDIEVGGGLRIKLEAGEELDKTVSKIRNAVGIFKKSNPGYKTLSVHVMREQKEVVVYRDK